MRKKREPLSEYVRKVKDQTRRLGRDLHAENEKLLALVARHQAEKTALEDQLKSLHGEMERHRHMQLYLQQQMAEIQADNQRSSGQYVALEQQIGNMLNLYVATYRLHETLDRANVLSTIKEIVANLIGSEEMGVFWLDNDRVTLRLLASTGIEASKYQAIRLGEGAIGTTARTGTLLIRDAEDPGKTDESPLTACIPLKVQDRVVGAIAIFRLLQQKLALESVDHDLLNLLGTQAAMALYCTEIHDQLLARREESRVA